jgi:RNA recognition motif-containing protein
MLKTAVIKPRISKVGKLLSSPVAIDLQSLPISSEVPYRLGNEMSKKLYVGNLSFQTTERDITSAFEQCGAVESVNIITDRDTGRSKGFGFVLMEDGGADKAIATLNGSQLNGRTLTVNEARPMVKKDFGRGDGGGRRRDRY